MVSILVSMLRTTEVSRVDCARPESVQQSLMISCTAKKHRVGDVLLPDSKSYAFLVYAKYYYPKL